MTTKTSKIVKMTRSNSKVPEPRDTKASARNFLAQFSKKPKSPIKKTMASKIASKYSKISKLNKTTDFKKSQNSEFVKKVKQQKIREKLFSFCSTSFWREKFRKSSGLIFTPSIWQEFLAKN